MKMIPSSGAAIAAAAATCSWPRPPPVDRDYGPPVGRPLAYGAKLLQGPERLQGGGKPIHQGA